ncbi:PKD domain-containing protein [Solirubrobacter taibaiensis]|nr:PKD domain-containing protein [Solirubrobacter taibaiensis]
MRRNALLLLGVILCAAVMAGPASAQVQPAGTGEPLYTNSTQNTQWLEWPATSGIDAYRVRYDYYENNALVANPTQSPAPNGATNVWANWSGVKTLQHGGQYGICAQGQFRFPNDPLWFPQGPNSCSMGTTLGRRAYTTIDRSKPTAALQVAGGRAFVNTTNLALKVDFTDDVAGPFPANFLCFQVGGSSGVCDTSKGAIYGYNASCSVPGSAGKATTFTCTADYGNIVDGDVWACVIAADASIPDNPSGPNQTGTADKANLSTASCDSVVVDRTPPVAAINTAATTVKVGDLLTFQGSATDATSGLTGPGEWTFGDSDAIPSGDTMTHIYEQPGTYELTYTVRDAAGNSTTVRKTITVLDTTPPPGDDDPGDDGPTDPGEVHQLRVNAPNKARARAEFIPVQLTATNRGRVQLQLLDGNKVLARATVRLDPDGTADHRLKLKKNTAPGRYVLKATWTPPRSAAITKLRNLRLVKSPSVRRRAKASSLHGAVVGAGPRALPDGAFHGTRPTRTFKVS